MKTTTRILTTAAAALAAAAPAASANVALCVPKTAGQAAFSGGDAPGTYCEPAQ